MRVVFCRLGPSEPSIVIDVAMSLMPDAGMLGMLHTHNSVSHVTA